LKLQLYDRKHALDYARRWALRRNPLFYDFKGIGGDCTSFVSQCLFAGCCTMNFTETFGWYYISIDERAPAWTGVEYLYNFLTTNREEGPCGEETDVSRLELGDVVQLGRADGTFYHTLVVTGRDRSGLLVSAHTNDAYNRPLSSYDYQRSRGIHILGYRSRAEDCSCFRSLYDGQEILVCPPPEGGMLLAD